MTLASAPTRRGRTILALGLVLGLGMSAASALPSKASAQSTAVTIAAPGAGSGATVTISRVTALVNQTVEVSWTGFLPSSSPQLQNSGSSYDTSTLNPVRVYECRSDDASGPASSSSCYGSQGFAGVPAGDDGTPAVPPVPGYTYAGQTDPYANTPDGPSNVEDTVTAADGTGSVSIQIFTRQESASLGCDENAPCALVVVPNYGRPQGATEDQLDAPWAWAHRTVIPLAFSPTAVNCPLGHPQLNVEGSPMSSRALLSWRGLACNDGAGAVTLNYTAIGEQQTREDFAAGLSDVGLTTQPLDPGILRTGKYVYAPVALSGVAIAFQVDDANGQPVRTMKLNQRLVAKLITASYRVADDPNVVGNPANLFHDPEFKALNPGVQWPSGAPGNHPLLMGDLSDLTWTLTSWIDADPEARAFLNGKLDPYGMHVNGAYLKLALPVASFPLLDQHQADTFQPIQGLDQVARQLSLAQFPGALSDVENGVTVVTKPARQNPGRREVIGIIDTANAAAFLLDTASLRNAGGGYVAPTAGALLATERHLSVNADGVTRQVDQTDKTKVGYPLTMVVNAALPLGAKGSRAAGLRHFLAFASGQGQVQGQRAGQLPPGYMPLPKDLLALDKAAQQALVRGTATPVKPTATPTVSPTTTRSTPTPTTTSPPVTAPPVATRPVVSAVVPATATPSPRPSPTTATPAATNTAPAPAPSATSTVPVATTTAAPAPVIELASVSRSHTTSVPMPLLVAVGLLTLIAGGAVRLLAGRRLPWRR
ncbi:MAG: hypothetical protein QOE76_2140 [Frankiales bacterium]|nr:hypothetical protein [Frankiales bacterium]